MSDNTNELQALESASLSSYDDDEALSSSNTPWQSAFDVQISAPILNAPTMNNSINHTVLLNNDIPDIGDQPIGNTPVFTGNTIYGFNTNTGDDNYDFSINTSPNITITDDGGIDTIDLSGFTKSQVIRMDAGAKSNIGGLKKNLTIASGTDIENIIGGTKRDNVYTNDLDNHIRGEAGNDRFYASLGDDILDGGSGTDRTYYNYDLSDFQVSIVNSTTLALSNLVDGFTDTLISIERFYFNSVLMTRQDIIDSLSIGGSSTNDTLDGDTGSNSLDGGEGHDTINAGDGNDILIGGLGNDTLNGGNGDDTADYSGNTQAVTVNLEANWADEDNGGGIEDTLISIESVTGTAYADTIYGNSAANTITAGNGNDNIRGGAGDDIIYAGSNNDTVSGGLDNDTIYGDGGRDTLYGNEGNDTIYGGGGNDTIQGNDGNDSIQGQNGADRIYGHAGNDILNGGGANDTLVGGTGDDTYLFSTGYGTDRALEQNSEGTDTIRITSVLSTDVYSYVHTDGTFRFQLSDGSILITDTYIKSNGESNIVDRFERVVFDGGETWDFTNGLVINSLSSDETFSGSTGNDTISTNAGADKVYAGLGDDTINGGAGDDTLDGQIGNDTINGGFNNDILYGRDGDDILNGDEGNDVILGGNNNDTISGGADNDTLLGENGNDTLNGDAGDDTLYGHDGDDILSGGDGFDKLSGGAGADTFIFEAANAFNNGDYIRDFSLVDDDKIDISDLLSGYDPLTDAIKDFVKVIEAGSHSYLTVDIDGTETANNYALVARIENATGLTDESALVASGNLII